MGRALSDSSVDDPGALQDDEAHLHHVRHVDAGGVGDLVVLGIWGGSDSGRVGLVPVGFVLAAADLLGVFCAGGLLAGLGDCTALSADQDRARLHVEAASDSHLEGYRTVVDDFNRLMVDNVSEFLLKELLARCIRIKSKVKV